VARPSRKISKAFFIDCAQIRKPLFLATKQYFPAVIPKGGQTSKYCFLTTFPKGGKPANIVS
jgi:hypothetical protein